MTKNKKVTTNTTDELLKDIIIIQLRLAGLGQNQIREIVGGDIYRVTKITKHIKVKKLKNDD